MTPNLRQVHRFSWFVLAVALPVALVAALRAASPPLIQEPVSSPLPAPLPVLVRSVVTDSMTVNLRQAAQGKEKQLEVVVKHPFETPSAVVRVGQAGQWRAVGLLNAPGVYRFPVFVVTNHPQVEIMDDVHKKTLRTVHL